MLLIFLSLQKAANSVGSKQLPAAGGKKAAGGVKLNGGFSDENASWLKPVKAGQLKQKPVQQQRGKGVPTAKGGRAQQQYQVSGKRKAPEPESEDLEEDEDEMDTGGAGCNSLKW
jgi:hypothetical protein